MEQGQQITEAVSIPVIGDGDNGYGNAMNMKRTVKGYIKAGFAGIILEDQVHFLTSTIIIFICRSYRLLIMLKLQGIPKSLWSYTRKESGI